jgi:hypothetical protein
MISQLSKQTKKPKKREEIKGLLPLKSLQSYQESNW